ncbi:hypothetical protein LHGZ1_2819 [Laribacter hongkongensis]|uniref:Uncharacterized protein n=1 Tax=Laribacter hongkongensis TaxID=168471 RepID=A0A248LLI1_9NEIS|nr:hypothetical protein LHGZ1_2819 [Laribacter hongkongensis]
MGKCPPIWKPSGIELCHYRCDGIALLRTSAARQIQPRPHIDLKQNGISNLRDMGEVDARLAESPLRALGAMQSPATAKAVEEPLGAMHA